MKKIIILMHYMELGGAESALLGLLQSHDPARADLDVFIYDHRGELMKYIPTEKVKLLPSHQAYALLERPIPELFWKGYIKLAFARLIGNMYAKRHARLNVDRLDDASVFAYQQSKTVKLLPAINPSVVYDLAISFMAPHYVVLEKVSAKKKIGWIHTDYSKVFVNRDLEIETWGKLDRIISISEEVGNNFSMVFPSLKDKLLPIENILSSDFIRRRATEFIPSDMPKYHNCVNILSIGRFCYQKRFDEIGTIARIIKESLLQSEDTQRWRFHWFLIGYGPEEEEAKIYKNLENEGMKDFVTILGKRSNPYPYIKKCDIYVQPSRYEGKSVTVREAQILGRLVIVANYPTASSQVVDGLDGIIAPFDNSGIAIEVSKVICNSQTERKITDYLKNNNFGAESEIEKIYKMIED